MSTVLDTQQQCEYLIPSCVQAQDHSLATHRAVVSSALTVDVVHSITGCDGHTDGSPSMRKPMFCVDAVSTLSCTARRTR